MNTISENYINNGSSGTNNKKLGFVVAGIFLLILIVSAALIMRKPTLNSDQGVQDEQSQTAQNNANTNTTPAPAGQAPNFPTVTVGSWVVPESITVPVVSTANVYQFKQQLVASGQTAGQLSLITGAQNEETPTRILAYKNDSAGNNSDVYYLLKETGSFLFTSKTGVDLPATTELLSEQEKVTKYIQSLVSDDKLRITAQYEKKGMDGVKFYELHRDWSAMGLPVYNLLGIFNLDNSASLSSLSLAKAPTKQAPDESIINSSDASDGFRRNNDFNTVTVGIKGGKVVSVLSNIRPIASVNADRTIISYTEALNRLKSKQYTSLYVSPDSAGGESAAQQSQVSLATAQVSEVTVAYLENLPVTAQQKLEPFYIFKGTGTSDGGKAVHFLASVAAVPSNVMGTSTQAEDLLALANPKNGGQQQGTLDMSGNPVNPIVSKIVEGVCKSPVFAQLQNVMSAANGITYGQYPYQNKLEWFFVPPSAAVSLQTFWDVFTGLQASVGTVNDRSSVVEITKDLERATQGCPIRLSGSSPTLFVYSNAAQQLAVTSGAALTLADPATTNGVWNVDVNASGMTVNGLKQPYLYYEYMPVTFTRPTQGWVVSKEKLNTFANNIASQMGLNAQETGRIAYELNHAAQKVNAQTLFVGVIAANQVNSKLPLTVSCNATVERVHFYVGAQQGTTAVDAPQVHKVTRTSTYVLEIGAAAGN